MPKLIFCSLVALLLVVSCECKDMHVRRMPDEKDIVFEGEVEKPQKTVYRKGESRNIQVRLTSNDEEAQDAKFKILSATLADGSPADVDYDTLKIGDNTLSYTPKEPGTHALTIKVAVEGEGEENVQILHCPIEVPLANWKVKGHADATGNIALTITNAPDEWHSEPWRITNTTFSEGLEGRIENMPTRLNHGENNLNISLDQIVLQEEEPHVIFTIQGPDSETRTCQIDLTALCVAQLRGDMSELDGSLSDRLLVVSDEHETETERLYQLPPETVTDPRVNREKQAKIEERLNLMERDLEAYDRDLQRLEALEVQDPTHPSRQLPMFRRGKKRLKDAIASLKSAQVQLQQQCTTAHESLFKTLENEEQEAIETLLEDPKLDVNGTNERGYSLLHVAAGQGNNNVVQTLLDNGARVNEQTDVGATALQRAAYLGLNDVVTTLLEKEAAVNTSNNQGWTALMYAAKQGHVEIVTALLEKEAAVNISNNKGRTALMYAAEQGHVEIVTALLEKEAVVNTRYNQGWTALMYAAKQGHVEIVTALLEKEAAVNTRYNEDWTVLMYAARQGHVEIVELLLENHADVRAKEKNGSTALHWATNDANNTEVIRMLLAAGAEVNVKSDHFCLGGSTALQCAAGHANNTEVIRMLLAAGADVNAKDTNMYERTPLLQAVENSRFAPRGSNIDQRQHQASFIEQIRILIEANSDVNMRNKDGHSILHGAARVPESYHPDILSMLKKAGAR